MIIAAVLMKGEPERLPGPWSNTIVGIVTVVIAVIVLVVAFRIAFPRRRR